jgi:LysM repeat protein
MHVIYKAMNSDVNHIHGSVRCLPSLKKERNKKKYARFYRYLRLFLFVNHLQPPAGRPSDAKHINILNPLSRMRMLLLFPLLLSLSFHCAQAQVSQDHVDYITRHKDIAMREMDRTGIPASIKLAQAILESDAGRSELARRANNHFGIKCGNDWRGDTYMQEDDDYNDRGQLIRSCFRVFRTTEASFVAHSEFLRDPSKNFRYGPLFQLPPTDYQSWAYGLQTAGYATSTTYATRLISIIERYRLYEYDRLPTVSPMNPAEEITASEVLSNNDVSFVTANPGETVAALAQRTRVAVQQLLNYNEKLNKPEQQLAEGERVYLQPKRIGWRGVQAWHTVRQGESMYLLSQNYGIRLDKFYERNRLLPMQEPAVGEKVKLRGSRVRQAPQLRQPAAEPVQPFSPVQQPVQPSIRQPEQPSVQPSTQQPAQPSVQQPASQGAGRPGLIIRPRSPAYYEQNAPAPGNPASSDPLPPVRPQEAPAEPGAGYYEPMPRPVTPSATSPSIAPSPPAGSRLHTVVKGDTLWNVSQRYGTNVQQLRQWNQLPDDNIRIGQQLRVSN